MNCEDIDKACLEVQNAISDATDITVGRSFNRGEFLWVVSCYVPRRDKNFKLIGGRSIRKTMELSQIADTFEEALTKLKSYAYYNATGTFQIDQE